MICCAESTPRPGISASRHFLVQLPDLLFDQLQLLQAHHEQSAVDGFELRARAQRSA
jgi:hypothetical protein